MEDASLLSKGVSSGSLWHGCEGEEGHGAGNEGIAVTVADARSWSVERGSKL